MRIPKVLALDDDQSWLSQIPLILEDECEVTCLSNVDQGIMAIQSHFYDVILLDINFENDPRSGIDLFRIIQASDRGADVIVISGETRPERIVQVMMTGVTSFLPKPTTPDQIREAIQKVVRQKKLKLRALSLAQSDNGDVTLIGNSLPMQKLRQEIAHAVQSGAKDILLWGETGSGKEVVAKAIYNQSGKKGKFVPMHCGAISDGLAESELFGHIKGSFTGADRDRQSAFELVKNGFIFFDEIGDMPLNQQAKLLRVLQERKIQHVGSVEEKAVQFHSISATHVNLTDAVIKKTFREDLYYRIAKVKIHVPALRDRRDDIPELVHHFIASSFPNKNITITNDSLELLMAYHWPGNVRQLQSAIEEIGSKINDSIIREKDICQCIPQIATVFGNKTSKMLIGRYGTSLVNKERERFETAILEFSGDRDKAAKRLGMSRSTFFRRAKELGLIKERRKIESEKIIA